MNRFIAANSKNAAIFMSNYEKLFTQFMNVFMNNNGWLHSWHSQGKTTGAQLMLCSWIGMVFKRSRQDRKLLLNRVHDELWK